METTKIQDRLVKYRDDISSLIAKEDSVWLLNYFKITDLSLLESWLSGQKMPTGLNLIRLVFFLYERHFVLAELAEANETIIQVIAILAKGIASPRVAADEIGYKEEYDLYKVLLGKRNYSGNAFLAMRLFVEDCEYKMDYAETKERVVSKQSETQTPVDYLNQNQLTIDLLHAIGNISSCLEPLLKKLTESTPEERQNFRASLGKDELGLFQISNSFFRVSELMNALCTEKSLENYKTKKTR